MLGPVLLTCGTGRWESKTPSVGHPVPSSAAAPASLPDMRSVDVKRCVIKLVSVLILGLGLGLQPFPLPLLGSS